MLASLAQTPRTPPIDSARCADDLELVHRVLARDRDAIDRFAKRLECIPRAAACINARFGRPLTQDDLADLAQDVFVTIWRKLATFAGLSRLEGWLYRYCFFEYLNRLRARRRDPHSSPLEFADAVADDRDTTAWADAEGVALALDRIVSHESAVIRLKHYSHLTFAQIAGRLSIPAATAKTRYYRGLRSLRHELGVSSDGPTE